MAKQSAPFLNGTAVIAMGADSVLAWHEIALSFQTANGLPYGAVTGSATMTATGAFADLPEAGANALDLTAQRRWAPFMSGVSEIAITVTGAPADAYCVATVTTSAAA
jgi:hypothetical protein